MGMTDVTHELVADASSGPGEYVSRFARARALTGALNAEQAGIVARLNGVRLGFTSKALVYDSALRFLSRKDQAMFARLVKGRKIRIFRVDGGYEIRAACE